MAQNGEKHDLILSVLSDIHVTWFDEYHYEGAENLERALRFHRDVLPASDAFLFTGDTVYQVESSEKPVCEQLYTNIYDRALSIINRYIPEKTPRYFVMGNHEYPQNNAEPEITKTAQEYFKNAYHQELFFHETVNGYHILGVSIQSWRVPQSPENEAFLMKETEKAIKESPEKPVFLMIHNPIPGTVTFSGKYTVGQFSDAFINWLKTKKQVIVLSGHCHNVNEDDSCIYQNGYTQVNIPLVAVGYMRFDGNGTAGFTNDYGNVFGKSQSVQILVDGGNVTIRSYDVASQKTVNEWIIDVSGMVNGTAEALYSDEAHAAWDAPAFGDAATAAVVEKDGAKFFRIRQDFKPYPYCIKYYSIDIENLGTGDRKTVTYPTDYFLPVRGEYAEKPVPKLAQGRYRAEIYLANAFGKRSDSPLIAEWEE